MSAAEVFILIGAGHVCGLMILFGFILSMIRHFFVQKRGALREIVWGVVMIANMVVSTLTPILLFAVLVVGDFPNEAFPARASLFLLGIATGIASSFVAAHLLNLILAGKVSTPSET